jgi:putative flippase GtrA
LPDARYPDFDSGWYLNASAIVFDITRLQFIACRRRMIRVQNNNAHLHRLDEASTAMNLALTYALLAAIATASNIAAQDVSIRIYHGTFGVAFSMLVGTGVGLVVKYLLDKRFIFRFKARDLAHDSQTFALYAFMGVFTTLIFWGVEFLFDHLFQTKELRYLGGVIGLAIGYFTKYHLDRKFVFAQARRGDD